MTKLKVGIIGLGRMGEGMSRRMIKAALKYTVTVTIMQSSRTI